MLMGINESRHDDAPLCVNKLGVRELFFQGFQIAHLLNCGSVDHYCPVLKKWLFGVSCNKTSISDHQHMVLSPFLFYYPYSNTIKVHLQG